MLTFVHALALHLQAGFDLATSWRNSLSLLEPVLSRDELHRLSFPPDLGLSARLRKLASDWPNPNHRMWFALISDLSNSGASLVPAVNAFAQTLRQEAKLRQEAQARALPSRINILVLVFFLPPAMLLLFAPLLSELLSSLPS